MSEQYAHVAVKGPFRQLFVYKVPRAISKMVLPGTRVMVPWRRKKALGYVLDVKKGLPSDFSGFEIKEIEDVLDTTPVFDGKMLELINWMSKYYCAPIGEVCRLVLPSRLSDLGKPNTTRPTSPDDIMPHDALSSKMVLTDEQIAIIESISDGLTKEIGSTHLIHGITGSGKTQIYLELFEKNIKMGKGGICLVPEISLTPQLAGRFYDRFKDVVAIYHSALSDSQRHEQWNRVRSGNAKIVIGTRSALFAPFQKLGLIVVDEEHDSSYKQSTGVPYNARDVAVMRAKMEGAVAVLGSATPSMESFFNCRLKKYSHHELKERPSGATLPTVEVVDLRDNSNNTISDRMISAIKQRLDNKEQTLIFLNRRGFANYMLCKACGYIPKCPNCEISLTYHKGLKRLICHYCDYSVLPNESCSMCGLEKMDLRGAGTERIEEELSSTFPDARIVRLDSDSMQNSRFRTKAVRDVKNDRVDILIGTQVVAKGHDFPNVTLVGVINADVQLNFPDFRAAEHTFQLLTQVAGRSGRSMKSGHVIVQTYNPDHYALGFSKTHDYEGFFKHEKNIREELGYPPFSRAINLRFSGNKADRVLSSARAVKKYLDGTLSKKSFKILGPSPSPIGFIRGKHRFQIMIRTSSVLGFSEMISLNHDKLSKIISTGVQFAIDVDPVEML